MIVYRTEVDVGFFDDFLPIFTGSIVQVCSDYVFACWLCDGMAKGLGLNGCLDCLDPSFGRVVRQYPRLLMHNVVLIR
jgi:hypothetical protein